MKPIMLYPVGVVLILCLFSLAGASKQLQIVQWWLNQLDSPQTATAGALAPIIDCVNRVDRDTRLAYYLQTQVDASVRTAERSGAANLPREEFGDNAEPQARLIQKQVCTPAITLQLERQAPGSPLITATQQYLQTLRRISDIGTLLSPNQTPGAKTPQQQLFGNVMLDQLKAELSRNGGGYLSASAALRDGLTREELRLRPLQLDLLEARLGRDLHWHLLNYMIASRQSIDRIDQGVRAADLTPQALAALTASVQRAQESAAAFVDQMPDKELTEETLHLWYTLRTPADTYLAALQGMLQDWLNHATPQQLSDDYDLVTRRYDVLLSYYNRPARNAF